MPLQGLALPVEIWERDVLPRRTGAYSPIVAGHPLRERRARLGRRRSARALGPGGALLPRGRAPRSARPPRRGLAGASPRTDPSTSCCARAWPPGPRFFTDLLAELDAPAEALREALWDLVWAGEVTNDAWAPLRAPRLALARSERAAELQGAHGPARPQRRRASRFSGRRRTGAQSQVQGRWSLTEAVFGGGGEGAARRRERRRALAELLLERYGIVTREQVLAEGIKGGFAMLYDTFSNLETLGVCRRGYFIEGMGGAQFALPGAVERLRAAPPSGRARSSSAPPTPPSPTAPRCPGPNARSDERRPARVAGAYVVLVEDEPVLYVERGGRGSSRSPRTPRRQATRPDASRTRCSEALRRSPTPSAPGACPSSRSSESTASPRSPRARRRCSSSSASSRARAGSR